MGKDNLIAIAFSDIHFHEFRDFNTGKNTRLEWIKKAFMDIVSIAEKSNVPVLFAGDLYHNPKELSQKTILSSMSALGNKSVLIYGISGNHDQSEKNFLDKPSPSYLEMFKRYSNFHLLDNRRIDTLNFIAWGIPYLERPEELKSQIKKFSKEAKKYHRVAKKMANRLNPKLRILILHSDMPNAETPTGFKVNEHGGINYEMFKHFDVVLCGHIHKGQRLYKNVWMLGCPIHQDRSNEGHECGYWEVYSSGKLKFKHLKKYPHFITLQKGETPSNNTDYFINPETVLVDEENNLGEFSLTLRRDKLAKRYLKIKNIKSKSKLKALINILNQPE